MLVADPAMEPLARRLQQEIESLGLIVRFEEAASAKPPAMAGGVATIRIASTTGGDVDMTIIDGAGGKTVSYRLVSPPSADPAASELIATRTVELLRAHLLELTHQEPRRQEPVVPVSRAAPPVSPHEA